MKKFIAVIIKIRYLIITILSVFFIVSLTLIGSLNINYRIEDYLPDTSDTKISLSILDKEFGKTTEFTLMVENINKEEAERIKSELMYVAGVNLVIFSVNKEEFYRNNCALYKVMVSGEINDSSVKNFTLNVKETIDDYKYVITGSVIKMAEIEKNTDHDVPLILIISSILIITLLILTSSSFFEPIIYVITIAFTIVFNLGSNIIFKEISYYTNSMAAIIQLALTIDYSIIIMHKYNLVKEEEKDTIKAITKSMSSSISSIICSALTTMAGLISLSFMSIKIGLDMALVFTKSILISVVITIILMPILIVTFKKPLEKLKHKELRINKEKLANFLFNKKIIITFILLGLALTGFVLSFKTKISYREKTTYHQEEQILKTFDSSTQIMILTPKVTTKDDANKEIELIKDIKNLKFIDNYIVKNVMSFTATLKTPVNYKEAIELSGFDESFVLPIFKYYFKKQDITLDDKVEIDTLLNYTKVGIALNEIFKEQPLFIKNIIIEKINSVYSVFSSENYSRIILELNLDSKKDEMYDYLDELEKIIDKRYDKAYIAGDVIVNNDIKKSFSSDLNMINTFTIVLIFIIILLIFKSVSIPVILIIVIQGAIYLSFSLSLILKEEINFLSYMVILAIQMGATIDYGIVYTSNYLDERIVLDKKSAMFKSIKNSTSTIVSSGIILTICGIMVSLVSKTGIIANIGYMLARGTIVSVVMVTILLPCILYLFDKVIIKTTWRKKI